MSSITLPASRTHYHDLTPERGAFNAFVLRHARAWMSLTLAASDMAGITPLRPGSLLALLPALRRDNRTGALPALHPFTLIFVAYFALRGLYPAIGMGPIEELRLLTISTSMIFVAITASSFWLHSEHVYSRMVFLLTWLFSLACLPAGRIFVRSLLARFDLWGEPVAIIGSLREARQVAEELRAYPKMGRLPAVIFDHTGLTLNNGRLPVLPQTEMSEFIRSHRIHSALVIYEDLNVLPQVRHSYRDVFERVLFVSGPQNALRLSGVSVQDFGGQLSLEIRQSLLDRWAQFQKRLIDVSASGLLLVLLAPFFGLVTLLILLDSPGPAFYFHNRLGKGGKTFRMPKFRTMYANADEILHSVLASDPVLQGEWDCYQKLKNDPRITPIGRLLRRFSIDELPQLWKVFTGEMSLVGPRPILLDQQAIYGKLYEHYVRVTPGMTGLWQVNGRSNTSFARRAELDVHYVMNWSIWLDVYILVRTIWVVISRYGAC